MDKNKVIELTTKIYKQTLLFPKKEPLRYKLREIADEILAKVIRKESKSEVEKDLEVIRAYFELIKWQNWVSYFDILKIKEGYEELGRDLSIEDLMPVVEEKKIEKIEKKEEDADIDDRKKKIISILRERESAQVGDIKKILPEISKRTLRRDFDALIKKGLVERIGESNNTFYKLN
jgi:DNA-binding transcriptional ArsR family regulator